MALTEAGKSLAMSWSTEMLTEMLNGRSHVAASAQARSSTHSPIGPINPAFSARGMKMSGGTSPRVG
jgi:hypothetical protein